MLTIFRRHSSKCPHTSRTYRRCSCPVSVEGSLGVKASAKASTKPLGQWRQNRRPTSALDRSSGLPGVPRKPRRLARRRHHALQAGGKSARQNIRQQHRQRRRRHGEARDDSCSFRRVAKGETLLRDAIRIASKTCGSECDALVFAYAGMETLHEAQGKTAEARKYAEMALDATGSRGRVAQRTKKEQFPASAAEDRRRRRRRCASPIFSFGLLTGPD